MEGLWSKAEPQELISPTGKNWMNMPKGWKLQHPASSRSHAEPKHNPGNFQHDLPFLELLPQGTPLKWVCFTGVPNVHSPICRAQLEHFAHREVPTVWLRAPAQLPHKIPVLL